MLGRTLLALLLVVAMQPGRASADEPTTSDTPETAVAPEGPPTDRDGALTVVGFSVAALGLIGFAVFGGLTLSEDAALSRECGIHCSPSRASALDTYALVADISAGVSLAGAITGIVFGVLLTIDATVELILDVGHEMMTIVPTGDRNGAGLAILGTF